jgi:hypothetical protein
MSRTESVIVGLCIASVCPAFLFFAACLIGFLVLPENVIPIVALSMPALGILLDLVFLKRWTSRVYQLNVGVLVFVYCFFSLVVLALCMGVPVFNVLLGLVAGAYVGRKLRHGGAGSDQVRESTRHVSLFAAAVIGAVCFLSAAVAVVSPSTPSDLQRTLDMIFGLQLAITWRMIAGLILVGGSALILLEYWLTKVAAMMAYRVGGNVA